jgi:hypothetical protein
MYSYRSVEVRAVFASESYRPEDITLAIRCNAVTFSSNIADLWLQPIRSNSSLACEQYFHRVSALYCFRITKVR